jgi:hypothetical protein
MAASCCTCMTWGISPPHASVVVPVLCSWAHVPAGTGLLVRGGDLSCEAETSRAMRGLVVRGGDLSCEVETSRVRQRLVVRGGDLSCEAETSRVRRRLVVGIPLVNWSEMQPTSRRLDILSVWVLTRILSPPCLESLP